MPRVHGEVSPRKVLSARTKTPEIVQAALVHWIGRNTQALGGLQPGQTRFVSSRFAPGVHGVADAHYVSFQQTLGDLPVEGTYLNFTVQVFGDKPTLTSLAYQAYPGLSLDTLGKLDSPSAEQKARDLLKLPSGVRPASSERKVRFLEGRWRLVQEMRFEGRPYRTAVDAHSGEAFAWDERVYAEETPEVRGDATGRGVAFDPVQTGPNLTKMPLEDLLVRVGGASVFTDSKGNFSHPAKDSGPVPVQAGLSGRWAKVKDRSDGGRDLSFEGAAVPGTPLAVGFNPEGAEEKATAQVNGYVHATLVHNWLVAKGVAPEGIDISLPVNTNIESRCNAYYDGESINFFKGAGPGSCINTAFDTVVYHEYGHFVDDVIGGITNIGLSEGWGDVLGMFMTGQHLVGEGFFGEKGTFIRNGENKYQYNRMDEAHKQGQAWMGFAWKLRENLIRTLGPAAGIAKAEALVVPVLLANSRDIPSAVRQVALRDKDGDGRSPNRQAILEAARVHDLDEYVPGPSGPLARATGLIKDIAAQATRKLRSLLAG